MNVFISYRRADTQDFAGRLADALRSTRGLGEVFIDVDGINAGEDFAVRLDHALAKADICLVIIGPNWDLARLADSNDFVRREIAAALASPHRVIPLLANGAAMPEPSALPEELRPLATLNAVSVRHQDFSRDVANLIDVMLGRAPAHARGWLSRNPWAVVILRIMGGMAAALIALLAVTMILRATTGRSLDALLGGEGPVWLSILAALGMGAALPFWLKARK